MPDTHVKRIQHLHEVSCFHWNHLYSL